MADKRKIQARRERQAQLAATEVRALAKYIHISPRKARLVVDLIRGKDVREATAILRFLPVRAAGFVSRVLKSAVANAESARGWDPEALRVRRAFVDESIRLKRMQAGPRGMGRPYLKRWSHITITVAEDPTLKKAKPAPETSKKGRKKAAPTVAVPEARPASKKAPVKRTSARKAAEEAAATPAAEKAPEITTETPTPSEETN
jgi:large subunit ribosomal protein L22